MVGRPRHRGTERDLEEPRPELLGDERETEQRDPLTGDRRLNRVAFVRETKRRRGTTVHSLLGAGPARPGRVRWIRLVPVELDAGVPFEISHPGVSERT